MAHQFDLSVVGGKPGEPLLCLFALMVGTQATPGEIRTLP